MPIASTAGRFDNAPAHIIIVSTMFATRELGTIHMVKETPRVDPAIKAARDEQKHREHQAKLSKAADIRKAREAIERLQKMELSRKHQREAKARKRQERKPEVFLNTTPAKRETWIKAYPPIPSKKVHSKKQRAIETIKERERRAKVRAERLKELLPAGYVLVDTVQVVASRHAVLVALRSAFVPAVRIGIKWYCNPEALQNYCIEFERYRKECLARGRAKILEMRRAKK